MFAGKKLLIIIPAFNEEKIIGHVLDSLEIRIPGIKKIDILLVDDGSTDKTLKVAKSHGIYTLHLGINRGLGTALGTGFEFAKINNYDFAVTFDADGQHKSKDIIRIVAPLLNKKADFVIGSRFIKQNNMPLSRKLVNNLSNIATFLLFNTWTTDSQSGLRGLSKKALNLLSIKSQRMEVSSEIIREAKRNRLKLIEVPIASIYTAYSLKKGQKISNAPNVVWKLVLQQFSN